MMVIQLDAHDSFIMKV